MGKPMAKDERSGSANVLANAKHEIFCQRMVLGDDLTGVFCTT